LLPDDVVIVCTSQYRRMESAVIAGLQKPRMTKRAAMSQEDAAMSQEGEVKFKKRRRSPRTEGVLLGRGRRRQALGPELVG
jgi:hypothetical protein